MESGRNQLDSSSSSTFAIDFFVSKEPSSPSAGFGSIFSPSTSKATIRDELGSDAAAGKKQDTQGREVVEARSSGYKSLDSIFDGEKGKVQQQPPCHLSSSIYYGGQDIYSDPYCSPSSTSVTVSEHLPLKLLTSGSILSLLENHKLYMKSDQYKKDGDEDDPHSASRGNWWQGSLYY